MWNPASSASGTSSRKPRRSFWVSARDRAAFSFSFPSGSTPAFPRCPPDSGSGAAFSPLPESGGQDTSESVDTPANVFGTIYQPIPASELNSWQLGALRTAEDVAGRGKVQIVRLAFEDTAGSRSASRFQAALYSVFRKRIAFIRGIGKAFPDDGMVGTNDLNTILIDSDSRQGVSYLMGHEIGYSIQYQRLDIYEKLSKSIRNLASDWSDYNEKLKKSRSMRKTKRFATRSLSTTSSAANLESLNSGAGCILQIARFSVSWWILR
jgi:hypothetical protein